MSAHLNLQPKSTLIFPHTWVTSIYKDSASLIQLNKGSDQYTQDKNALFLYPSRHSGLKWHLSQVLWCSNPSIQIGESGLFGSVSLRATSGCTTSIKCVVFCRQISLDHSAQTVHHRLVYSLLLDQSLKSKIRWLNQWKKD